MSQNASIEDTLKRLDWLEDYSELNANAKDQIRTLRMHLRFLKMFLVSVAKLSAEDMNDFMSRVQKSVQNVRDGLCDENRAVNLEKLISGLVQEIKELIPDITKYYIDLSQLETTMSNGCRVELVNSLLKNLMDLIKYKTGLTVVSLQQIEALEVKFRFLRNFVWFSSINCINHPNIQDLLALIEVVSSTVACLSFQCLFEDEIDEDMEKKMKAKFSQVLWTIELIRPGMRDAYINSLKDLPSRLDSNSTMVNEVVMGFLRSFLDDVEELLRYKSILNASAEIQLQNLREELKFLIALLMDHAMQDDILAHTEAVARKTAPVIHLLLVSTKDDGAINEVVLYELHDLLNEINLVKKEMRKACPDPSESMRSNFPMKKNASVLIDFVLRALTEILSYKTESIALVRHQVKIAEAELVCLKILLDDKLLELEANEEEDLQMAVTDVVHEAKHAIGSFIIRERPLWYCMLQLSDAIKKIRSVNHKLSAPFGETVEIGVDADAQSSDSLSSVSTIQVYKMEVTGEDRNTEAEELKRRLNTGSARLAVISVVVTSKQNVTFVREEVFYDRTTVGHFQVCAWINVRQEDDKRALLIDILIRIVKDAEFARSVNQLSEKEAAKEMDKCLQKVRYLIVLDNTLSTGTWDTISGCFQNNNNGSRILFISF
ncbi:putative late blight resistance protein homolog R1B-23 [Solanum verrucosum]|uniref:putative late blight resistance protein homolog R1B-23 n=1 Tax=Solanum verrucosum TaxID=315347 RepID=UPI0020D09032|nr:putative late blight resistance protein homolog R1B-23 [Solanum verrucosum]